MAKNKKSERQRPAPVDVKSHPAQKATGVPLPAVARLVQQAKQKGFEAGVNAAKQRMGGGQPAPASMAEHARLVPVRVARTH